MTVHLVHDNFTFSKFIKCLESLPNPHTLEIGQVDYHPTGSLKNALGRVELPYIRVLILLPYTFPPTQSCRNAEDVVDVFIGGAVFFEEFCEFLAFNQDSKVKRLAIPMISRNNLSSKRSSVLWVTGWKR